MDTFGEQAFQQLPGFLLVGAGANRVRKQVRVKFTGILQGKY